MFASTDVKAVHTVFRVLWPIERHTIELLTSLPQEARKLCELALSCQVVGCSGLTIVFSVRS